jgi:hypothetical protein
MYERYVVYQSCDPNQPTLFSEAEMGRLIQKGFKVVEDFKQHQYNEEVKWLQQKMFDALRIPKEFLEDKAQ